MEVQQDKPFIIAYYLPQYHPIPENDEWWGNGFTEWTNVAKAKPLFKGHYQPRIPADLGFYDLRVPEVREQQAELAREAGVDGFCYWHYWFGNGKELLERPFKEVVESGKPDFPFCLGWANEDWQAKVWNVNGTHHTKQTLIKQSPPNTADNERHFYRYLKAFRDDRYIRSNGRPIFVIYKPFLDGIPQFISDWNRLAQKEGLSDGFYFIGTAENESESESITKMGFSAVTLNVNNRMCSPYKKRPFFIQKINEYLHWKLKKPVIIDYLKSSNFLWNAEFDVQENFIPTILPNWDHSPRSGKNAIILKNATPESFKKLCLKTFCGIQQKRNKIIFLKSWNEWGEGNYMEPDLKYGKQYIKALYSAIMESSKSD
ncbi:MAG: glycoside hydrolase family 99-like domain-containing protein [Fibrobacter sp.]|nr:glycoside hydrolase family 99-like domain-containing protein [Fibrobacter sp.]